MTKTVDSQKLASLLLDYLRATNQSMLPPSLVQDLQRAARDEDESNTVIVTSAVKLDTADKKTIESYVIKKTGEQRKITYILDVDLLAGLTVKIGDELLDASLHAKLQSLKDHLTITR